MSIHQIIYTSCMRGINGVNDGQQVYSYDAGFQDWNSDEVKSLFTYQHPALETGVVMSEELARTMPASFLYRRLDSGACALALNTYLGRDYMGSAGRFGNHLSHVIVFDRQDAACYPAEYWGGAMLRSSMTFEEVNSPEPPPHFPAPVLERGFAVDIDAVTDFLGEGDRLEIYKNMLHAMLAFERERKRVVICDRPENIILWIAALGYALPLKNALGVSFSTYDFDPSLSASQICGVVSGGTRFNADSHRLHFVFDLLEGIAPEFEKDADFFDFVDTAMSFSYESLQDFHTFLCSGYRYEGADEDLCAAYTLYAMRSDGLSGISLEKLDRALDFARRFAIPQETQRIVRQLLGEQDVLLRGDSELFLRVLDYVCSNADGEEPLSAAIKELAVDRVLCEFLNGALSEADFFSLYKRADAICDGRGISIAAGLMMPEDRTKLFSVMRQNIAPWKLAFIVDIISEYVKDEHIPVSQLSADAPLGQTYYGIIKAVYTQNPQNGYFVVTRILEAYGDDCTYLVNMGLNLEGVLLDLHDGSREAEMMWRFFGQLMASRQGDSFDVAWSIFGGYRRYDRVYQLYTLALEGAAGFEGCRTVFDRHYRTFVQRDPAYAGEYRMQVLEAYESSLRAFDGESVYGCREELFRILYSEKLDISFADNLVRELVRPIPVKSPSRADGKLLQDIFNYTYNFRRKPVTGKALLLIIAMVLENVRGRSEFAARLEQLQQLTRGGRGDLTRASEKGVEDYFDWLLPVICELCGQTKDLEAIYDLFEMAPAVERQFFARCARLYLKQDKGEKNHGLFCRFLGLVFRRGNSSVREEVGRTLCRLNKQKLEDLDAAVKENFREDAVALMYWEEIRKTAEDTNPILSNISGIFKRRKD